MFPSYAFSGEARLNSGRTAGEGERDGKQQSNGRESSLGDTGSPSSLVAVVYNDLRRLASRRLAKEYGPQTLQATALVHEAWLRLGGENQPNWENRAQFFAAAAEAMRRILVDRARRRKALRHGGAYERVALDALNWEEIDTATAESNDDRVITLHEALERFALEDPQAAELVKLRYFNGMSLAETADLMEISESTARRWMAYGRAWLRRAMQDAVSE